MAYARRRKRRRGIARTRWKWAASKMDVPASIGTGAVADRTIDTNDGGFAVRLKKIMMWLSVGEDIWAGLIKVSEALTSYPSPFDEPEEPWLWWCPGWCVTGATDFDTGWQRPPAYIPIILRTSRTLNPGEKLVLSLHNKASSTSKYQINMRWMSIEK